MTKAPARIAVPLLVAVVCLGCSQWEELPEGATAFLQVDEASLSGDFGTLDGREGRIKDATGFCYWNGFSVETVVDTGNGLVMGNVRIADLNLRGIAGAAVGGQKLTFVSTGGSNELVEQGSTFSEWESPASATVEGCSGAREEAWEYEAYAERVELEVVRIEDTNRRLVLWDAGFANGQNLRGQFQIDMPVTD